MSTETAIATGDNITTESANWKFSSEVAANFNQHVIKSVPGYLETQQLVLGISDWFVSDGSTVLDIGCATGSTLFDLCMRHQAKQVRYVGVDPSAPMIDQSRIKLAKFLNAISLINSDIMSIAMPTNIGLALSLYTLQFIPPQQRFDVLRKVYNNLARRGAFILVEKVLDEDPILTDIFVQLHWAKKAELGFDVNEIYNKAQSLRGVLVPLTDAENVDLLKQAGFSNVSTFYKYANFQAFIAIK